MTFSVVVVTHREHPWLRPCLSSVLDQAEQVIVVDNASPAGFASREARALGAQSLRSDRNLGFPAAVNLGIERTTGDLVAVLNDDAMAAPAWLARARHVLADETVGAVAPKILFARRFAEYRLGDDRRWIGDDPRPLGRMLSDVSAGGVDVLEDLIGPGVHEVEREPGRRWRWTTGPEAILLPLPLDGPDEEPPALVVDGQPVPPVAVRDVVNNAGSYLSQHGYGGDYGYYAVDDGAFDQPGDRFGVCGAAFATRRSVLERVGHLAGEFFAYYEDTDWSWRLQAAGLRVRYDPAATVRHVGGVTSGGPEAAAVLRLADRNRLLFLVRNAPNEVARASLQRAAKADGGRFVRDGGALVRALLQRPQLRRRAVVAPGDVWRTWAGVGERWPGQAPLR